MSTLDPRHAAGVLGAEARLLRALRLLQALHVQAALEALRRPNPEIVARPAIPRHLVDRIATVLAQLAAQGHADQVQQITEALNANTRRSFAKKGTPHVSAADVATYHDLAAGMVSQLADDLYAKLRSMMVEGLRAGRSDAEIGLEIHAADLGLARSHANTWARTETTRFYTLGRTQAVEEAGDYVWGYEYVVIVDTRTTVICQGFIGKRVAKALMRLFPPFHFNCRTTVIAVMAQWITDEEEQPDGTELGPVSVAEGFGGDPRRLAA